MPRSRRRARAGPYARRAVPLEGCSGTPAASIEHRRPRLAYETGPATVQVVSLLPPQHDHCTSAPCKRACSAPRMSSRGKFEHANALSAHHATFGRERGGGVVVPTPGHPRACHGAGSLHHRHQAVPPYGVVTAPDPGMCVNQPRAPRAPGARPDQNCGIDSPILALAARTRARARGRSRRFGRRSSMRPAIGAAFGSLSRHLTRNGGRCQSQQAELVLHSSGAPRACRAQQLQQLHGVSRRPPL